MKTSIPPSVEQDSAGTIDEQSRYGEEEDARRAVAIEGVYALSAVAVDGEDRRQNGDRQCCYKSEIEDKHSAHDALSVHRVSISPGD